MDGLTLIGACVLLLIGGLFGWFGHKTLREKGKVE